MRIKTKVEKLEEILKPKESTIFICYSPSENLTADEEAIIDKEVKRLEKRGGVHFIYAERDKIAEIHKKARSNDKTGWRGDKKVDR